MTRRDDDESAGHRHARLQGLILEELRALLRDDVSDPRLYDARIAAVVLSVDYRNARVHFTVSTSTAGGDARSPSTEHTRRVRAEKEEAFARATAFLRARLAEAIDMKRVPELRFVFDGIEGDS
jgi:ribosome-binding factor A